MTKIFFWIRTVGALLAVLFCSVSSVWANGALLATAEEIAASDDVIGLAVAVVRNGEVETIRTFGVRDLENRLPVEPETVFRIASLSKGFTSSLVARLVEEGALSFDEPITAYASDFRLKAGGHAKATLGHVLSHRVGLPPYAYDNLLEADTPPPTIRMRLGGVDPICSVGNCYAYQNVAFDAARFAVEAKEGAAFADILTRRIFEPLGMETASVGMTPFVTNPNRAISYSRRRGDVWREREVKPAYYNVPAAGGVNASITDMAAWLAAQMGGAPEILSDEARAMMQKPQVETIMAERRMQTLRAHMHGAWYGYGWRIYDYAGATVINHSGSVEGYSAQIAFIPERNVGVVFLTNSRSRPFFELMPAFLNEELGLPVFEPAD